MESFQPYDALSYEGVAELKKFKYIAEAEPTYENLFCGYSGGENDDIDWLVASTLEYHVETPKGSRIWLNSENGNVLAVKAARELVGGSLISCERALFVRSMADYSPMGCYVSDSDGHIHKQWVSRRFNKETDIETIMRNYFWRIINGRLFHYSFDIQDQYYDLATKGALYTYAPETGEIDTETIDQIWGKTRASGSSAGRQQQESYSISKIQRSLKSKAVKKSTMDQELQDIMILFIVDVYLGVRSIPSLEVMVAGGEDSPIKSIGRGDEHAYKRLIYGRTKIPDTLLPIMSTPYDMKYFDDDKRATPSHKFPTMWKKVKPLRAIFIIVHIPYEDAPPEDAPSEDAPSPSDKGKGKKGPAARDEEEEFASLPRSGHWNLAILYTSNCPFKLENPREKSKYTSNANASYAKILGERFNDIETARAPFIQVFESLSTEDPIVNRHKLERIKKALEESNIFEEGVLFCQSDDEEEALLFKEEGATTKKTAPKSSGYKKSGIPYDYIENVNFMERYLGNREIPIMMNRMDEFENYKQKDSWECGYIHINIIENILFYLSIEKKTKKGMRLLSPDSLTKIYSAAHAAGAKSKDLINEIKNNVDKYAEYIKLYKGEYDLKFVSLA